MGWPPRSVGDFHRRWVLSSVGHGFDLLNQISSIPDLHCHLSGSRDFRSGLPSRVSLGSTLDIDFKRDSKPAGELLGNSLRHGGQ